MWRFIVCCLTLSLIVPAFARAQDLEEPAEYPAPAAPETSAPSHDDFNHAVDEAAGAPKGDFPNATPEPEAPARPIPRRANKPEPAKKKKIAKREAASKSKKKTAKKKDKKKAAKAAHSKAKSKKSNHHTAKSDKASKRHPASAKSKHKSKHDKKKKNKKRSADD